jgi:protein-serine/threonine kinase
MNQRQSEETVASVNSNASGGSSTQSTQLSASPSGQQRSSSPASTSSAGKRKGDDYVYFERSTDSFSSDAVSRATAAKLKLESYYKLAVDAAIERNGRCANRSLVRFIS